MAVMFVGRAAHAEGTLPNGADLNFNKFQIEDPDSPGDFIDPDVEDDKRFFLNYAHCTCSQANAGTQLFRYEITATAIAGGNRPAEVWLGTDCLNDTTRATNCRKIEAEGIGDIDALVAQPAELVLSVFDVVNASPADAAMTSCKTVQESRKIWLLVDHNADTMYEYAKTTDVPGVTTAGVTNEVTQIDTLAPSPPPNLRVKGGEGQAVITWTAPTSSADVYLYQALCADLEDNKIGSTKARFQTTQQVCGITPTNALTEADTGGDGTPVTLPAPFAAFDPQYVCGEAMATATSLTINSLDNGKPYKVALLAMDRAGNVSGVWFNRTVTPEPVTDLWEDLHDRDSAIDGGCLLSQTYGDGNPLTRALRDFRDTTLARSGYGRALTSAYYATLGRIEVEGSLALRVIAAIAMLPLVVLALLWHALTLPGLLALIALVACWRRIRLKRLALALGLLAPTIASADDFEPYWATDEQDDASLLTFPEVTWHVGVKAGPYIPEIDLQAGLNAATGLGPYEAMFGDYYTLEADGVTVKKHEQRVWQVLPMLDVDRVLWDGFGQVTVGGTIGYMQKSAYPYLNGTSQDDEMRIRSTTGKNTFRLIPGAATVGYRFTYLDDAYGIPVVPYVKGGLSYYVWWMKAPNGDLSKICDPDSPEGMCTNENKAYGGSFGFQGSVGISIRAERIDADAATSMRSSGLMHAGFYAELSYAKVDGFGSDSKLSVGDNTWFAGVDFEF